MNQVMCKEKSFEHKNNITRNPPCILQHYLSDQNKEITKRQIVLSKYPKLKNMLHICFKKNQTFALAFRQWDSTANHKKENKIKQPQVNSQINDNI